MTNNHPIVPHLRSLLNIHTVNDFQITADLQVNELRQRSEQLRHRLLELSFTIEHQRQMLQEIGVSTTTDEALSREAQLSVKVA